MAIGEFSERSGLSAKQLRSYAASALLVPAAVDSATGYRFYSPGQLRDARLIEALRRAGMPLADIASMLRSPNTEALDEWSRRIDHEAMRSKEALGLARRLLAVLGPHEVSSVDRRRGAAMARFETASRTDRGLVREANEDAVIETSTIVGVADGMGGHRGGAVASALAVAMVEGTFTGRSPEELDAAVRAANRAVWERSREDPDLGGMGTTLCCAGLLEDGVAIVNVGDSRAYLWRDGSLTQLTEDHSVTAELVRQGELSEQDVRSHPHVGVLTRALGVAPDVEVDRRMIAPKDGDRLLVCSDGLVNELDREEIGSLLAEGSLQSAANALVEAGLGRGGHDNISVVVAEVLE
jgi:PPM family protein phosphatase